MTSRRKRGTRLRPARLATITACASGILWSPGAWAQAADAAPSDGGPTTITWSGLPWIVKTGPSIAPGPNAWSTQNVFVDSSGDLHLQINQIDGVWTCAEIVGTTDYDFGTFQWQVESPVDQLDPNVVLGLFGYGPPKTGPDQTHEIDIETSRFGSPTADNEWFTVWPNQLGASRTQSSAQLSLGTSTRTSRFIWGPSSVVFSTLAGYVGTGSNADLLNTWAFQPADAGAQISQDAMPVHMNLWLNDGNAPTNGQPVDVVIHNFTYVSSIAEPPTVPALPSPWHLALQLGVLGGAAALAGRRARRTPEAPVAAPVRS